MEVLRILIVEDAPNLRRRLRKAVGVEALGYRLRETANAHEARQALAEWQPNLILLDLAIPSRPRAKDPDWRHGRDLLREVRKRTPHIKVIVLTSHGELARDFLLEEGAADFFAKDDPDLWRAGKLNVQVAAQIGQLVCASPATRQLRGQLDELSEADRVVVIEGTSGSGRRHLASLLHCNSLQAHLACRTLDLTGASGDEAARALVGTPSRVGALGDPDVGSVVLVNLARAQPAAQNVVGQVCREAAAGDLALPSGRAGRFADRLVVIADGTLPELHKDGAFTEDLYSALHPGAGGVAVVLHLPAVRNREEDLPLLIEQFAREEAARRDKTITSVDAEVARVSLLSEDLRTAAQLRTLLGRAVDAYDGDKLLPSHLPLDLPERYQVVFNDGAGRQELRLSDRDLSQFTDPERFELIVFLKRGADDHLTPQSLLSKGEPVEIGDPRLLRLLLLLLRNAGEKVDLKANKRRLGIAAAEPMKRFLFELRQALNDPVIEKTRSHYFTGHWGEACTFHEDVTFALVTELKRGRPEEADGAHVARKSSP